MFRKTMKRKTLKRRLGGMRYPMMYQYISRGFIDNKYSTHDLEVTKEILKNELEKVKEINLKKKSKKSNVTKNVTSRKSNKTNRSIKTNRPITDEQYIQLNIEIIDRELKNRKEDEEIKLRARTTSFNSLPNMSNLSIRSDSNKFDVKRNYKGR